MTTSALPFAARVKVTNDYEFALKGVTNTVFVETNTDVALTGMILNVFDHGVTQIWTATGGTLTNATILTPTFTVPAGAGTDYSLTLTEAIAGLPSCTDTMTVGSAMVDGRPR